MKHPVITEYVIKTPKLSKSCSDDCQFSKIQKSVGENTEDPGQERASSPQMTKTGKPVRRKKPRNGEKLPGAIRFVFFSDLHGKKYGEGNKKLLSMIREAHPDYILMGGDMIVSRKEQYDIAAYDLLEKITRIAPAYMAFGNHEQTLKPLAEDPGLSESAAFRLT